MPAFVISDKRKDLVSLLVSALLGVASDLVERVCGGLYPCNKAIHPSPNVQLFQSTALIQS